MTAEKMTPAERLVEARKEAGYRSARSAATTFNWKPATYGAHENGSRGFDMDAATEYGRAFRKSPFWLLYGRDAATGDAIPEIDAPFPEHETDIALADIPVPHPQQMRERIPVRGTAAGAIVAEIEGFQLEVDVIEYRPKPPSLAGIRDVYAIYVTGDSMYPAHPNGEIRVVHPHRRPRIGDTVVVQTIRHDSDPGQAYIKVLKAQTPSKVILEQFNPPSTLEIPTRYLKAMHYVFTVNDLLGV